MVTFVVNRTLLRDPRRFLRRCRLAADDRGWKPWFVPTSEAEDGLALTRRAVAAGASLVFAVGGDGTVRACAEALAGTGVPLAIVPLGTANLTARALGVPARADRAVDAGFDGQDRRIDLARLDGTGLDGTGVDVTSRSGTEGRATRFAAMAGIGLDAAVVEAADEQLKRRLGWVAYAVSGVTRLSLPPRDFTVRLDDAEPLRRRARCVVVANAGLLPGGFTLLPGARLDDGLLDVGILAPAGTWGWVRVAGRVLARGRRQDHSLERFQARRVQVSADVKLPRQVDGEIVAPGQTLSVSVCPGVLVVRQAAADARRAVRGRDPRGLRDLTVLIGLGGGLDADRAQPRGVALVQGGVGAGLVREWLALRGLVPVTSGHRGWVDLGPVNERGVALQDRVPLVVANPQRHRGHPAGVADDDPPLGVDPAGAGVGRAGGGHARAARGGEPGAALERPDEDLGGLKREQHRQVRPGREYVRPCRHPFPHRDQVGLDVLVDDGN